MATYDFEGRYTCTHGTSNKFYEIHYDEASDTFHCSWGPIGGTPQTIRYSYDRVMKKVREFPRKHYRKVGRGARPRQTVIDSTPIFEPTNTKARLGNVADDEEIVTKKKAAKKEEKKFVPTGRLASIDDED